MLTNPTKEHKGQIRITSGSVVVSDPCNCQHTVDNIRKGTMEVVVVKRQKMEFWGVMEAYLVVHASSIVEPDLYDKEWEEVGVVGVDSGQVGVFDEPDYHEDDYDEYCNVCNESVKGSPYFICNSGLGDGGYPFSVLKQGDEVVAIKIDFNLDPYCYECGKQYTEATAKELDKWGKCPDCHAKMPECIRCHQKEDAWTLDCFEGLCNDCFENGGREEIEKRVEKELDAQSTT